MLQKLKEVMMAVIPIAILVVIIHLFLTPLTQKQFTLFAIGVVLVLFGLAIFLLGVDISISRMGHILGHGLTKTGNIKLLVAGGILIGFIVSIAEPSLTILGDQIATMSNQSLSQMLVVVVVSLGVAFLLALGMLRIVFAWNISKIVTIFYVLIFVLAIFVDEAMVTFAFDSSGATTGALTVPFVLALSAGISSLSNEEIEQDDMSFGLVGIASIGPILAMLILGLFSRQSLAGQFIEQEPLDQSIALIVWESLKSSIGQIVVGVIPLLVIFLIYHYFIEKQTPQTFKDIMVGLGYLMFGLVLFLTGVSAGFMPISQYLGGALYQSQAQWVLVLIGFILGVMAILAEPAIYVLINQIEDETGGSISKNLVLVLISSGVGVAIALTVLRILNPSMRLWHILLPGFILIILLSQKVPKLFVGMGFDSGGVASGPMTGTFIFAYVQGIAIASPVSDPVIDGFGMIAVVAMVPILFIEILGWVYLKIEQNQQE